MWKVTATCDICKTPLDWEASKLERAIPDQVDVDAIGLAQRGEMLICWLCQSPKILRLCVPCMINADLSNHKEHRSIQHGHCSVCDAERPVTVYVPKNNDALD